MTTVTAQGPDVGEPERARAPARRHDAPAGGAAPALGAPPHHAAGDAAGLADRDGAERLAQAAPHRQPGRAQHGGGRRAQPVQPALPLPQQHRPEQVRVGAHRERGGLRDGDPLPPRCPRVAAADGSWLQLLIFTEADLKELGIAKGPRVKMLRTMHDWHKRDTAPDPGSETCSPRPGRKVLQLEAASPAPEDEFFDLPEPVRPTCATPAENRNSRASSPPAGTGGGARARARAGGPAGGRGGPAGGRPDHR